MLVSEGLNDIVEDPTSEWGDDGYFEDDDEVDDELDLKSNIGLNQRNSLSRPGTTRSSASQFRTDSKRLRSKHSRQPIFGFTPNKLKRDPIIESIIESRKSVVIENVYTSLAQTTSQALRPSQNTNIFKFYNIRSKTLDQVHFKDRNNQIINSENEDQLSLTSTIDFDNDQWDDGLNTDFDKDSIASNDKSCVQVYEEKCKRLKICPSSTIIRSLYTTHINLQNYGLGTKGSAALAVALVRNITVLSVNLSGNNIGSSGMSHIYQILTENTYIEEYDLSNNNLGSKGCQKLAAAAPSCVHLRVLNIAGNGLIASDINNLLSKFEDHLSLTDLNISHNQLDEEGGIYVAKWLSDNNVLLNFDVSWCSIRLTGARALAKAIGDNTKLISLNLSYNSFTNDTIEILTNSLISNTILKDLNLYGNEIFCRYEPNIRDDPSILIIGKEAIVYKMLVAAATNQSLRLFCLGKNHLDARCIMILLESLSKLDNISLEELDLTSLTLTSKQISDIEKLFVNHSKFTCYVGPIKQTVEYFANNLLNLIHTYCKRNQLYLIDIFGRNENNSIANYMITYEQFRDGLRKSKIPFPVAQFENIVKYLGRDDDEGTISLRSLGN